MNRLGRGIRHRKSVYIDHNYNVTISLGEIGDEIYGDGTCGVYGTCGVEVWLRAGACQEAAYVALESVHKLCMRRWTGEYL